MLAARASPMNIAPTVSFFVTLRFIRPSPLSLQGIDSCRPPRSFSPVEGSRKPGGPSEDEHVRDLRPYATDLGCVSPDRECLSTGRRPLEVVGTRRARSLGSSRSAS